MRSIDVNELKRDIGAPAFIAARFALILSTLSLIVSALAVAVAIQR